MTLKELRKSKSFNKVKIVQSEQILIDYVKEYQDGPICGIVTFEFSRYWFERVESDDEIDENPKITWKYAILDIGHLIESEIETGLKFIAHKKNKNLDEFYKSKPETRNYEDHQVMCLFILQKIPQL
jgi:hypothetical protein